MAPWKATTRTIVQSIARGINHSTVELLDITNGFS